MAAVTGAIIGAAGAIGASAIASNASRRATNAQTRAAQDEIDYLRETRDLAREDTEPYRRAGHTALDALMSMTGLSAPRGGTQQTAPTGSAGPTQVDPMDYLEGLGGTNNPRVYPRYHGGALFHGVPYMTNEFGPENLHNDGSYTRSSDPRMVRSGGYVTPNNTYDEQGNPIENPGGVEGGFNFMTDPGYNFRFSEGMRALDRGASAAGGLLSGGYARRAIRYGQDYASNEYTNVYNRIANIAGLGQVGNQQYTGAATALAPYAGRAYSNAGYARASGAVAQGNIWGNAINQIAQLPWDDWFGGSSSGGGTGGPRA